MKINSDLRRECTLPKTNIATGNGWLEDESSFWEGRFSEANC